MKKILQILFVLLFSVYFTLTAQEYKNDKAEGVKFSHSQVAATAWIPYGTFLTGIGTRYLFPSYSRGYVMAGFSAASDISSCIVDPSYSVPMTILGTGMMVSDDVISRDMNEYSFSRKTCTSVGHFGMDMNMYTAYHGYETARKQGPKELYSETPTVTFKELLLSPFSPEVMSQKYVYVPVLTYSSLLLVSNISSGFEKSVFKSGKGYFGNNEVSAAFGCAVLFLYCLVDFSVTGAGEEALFRGAGYEEMKVSFGLLPAKITDSICFAGAHVPQDIVVEEKSSGEVANAMVVRTFMGLLLQYIYDNAGLRGSAAAHMWIDTVITMTQFIFNCGVENDYTFSIGCKINL